MNECEVASKFLAEGGSIHSLVAALYSESYRNGTGDREKLSKIRDAVKVSNWKLDAEIEQIEASQ